MLLDAKYSQSRSCLSRGLLSTLSLTVQTVTLYSLPGVRPVNVTLVSMSSTILSFVVLFSSLIRKRYRSNLDDWTGVRVYLNVNESGWSWSTTTTTSDCISGTEFDRLVFLARTFTLLSYTSFTFKYPFNHVSLYLDWLWIDLRPSTSSIVISIAINLSVTRKKNEKTRKKLRENKIFFYCLFWSEFFIIFIRLCSMSN